MNQKEGFVFLEVIFTFHDLHLKIQEPLISQ